MIIDVGPKFYWVDMSLNPNTKKNLLSTVQTLAHDLQVKVTGRSFMLKFSVKVFKISEFLHPCMDLLNIWHDYRYWFKFLFSSIPTPAYDLEVKVRDSEIYVKALHQSFDDLLISKSLHGFTLYPARL